jgi:hypothetical protein
MEGGNGLCFGREKNQTVFRTDCERKQSVLRVGGGLCSENKRGIGGEAAKRGPN